MWRDKEQIPFRIDVVLKTEFVLDDTVMDYDDFHRKSMVQLSLLVKRRCREHEEQIHKNLMLEDHL